MVKERGTYQCDVPNATHPVHDQSAKGDVRTSGPGACTNCSCFINTETDSYCFVVTRALCPPGRWSRIAGGGLRLNRPSMGTGLGGGPVLALPGGNPRGRLSSTGGLEVSVLTGTVRILGEGARLENGRVGAATRCAGRVGRLGGDGGKRWLWLNTEDTRSGEPGCRAGEELCNGADAMQRTGDEPIISTR